MQRGADRRTLKFISLALTPNEFYACRTSPRHRLISNGLLTILLRRIRVTLLKERKWMTFGCSISTYISWLTFFSVNLLHATAHMLVHQSYLAPRMFTASLPSCICTSSTVYQLRLKAYQFLGSSLDFLSGPLSHAFAGMQPLSMTLPLDFFSTLATTKEPFFDMSCNDLQ